MDALRRPVTTPAWVSILTVLILVVEVVVWAVGPSGGSSCDARGAASSAVRLPAGSGGGGSGGLSTRARPVGTGACDVNSGPSFWAAGVALGTDKVTLDAENVMSHQYQFAYERYLKPIRCAPLKLLEVGLGCNMPYGRAYPPPPPPRLVLRASVRACLRFSRQQRRRPLRWPRPPLLPALFTQLLLGERGVASFHF